MRITAVIVATVPEQMAAGNHMFIIPEGVRLPTTRLPLWADKARRVPEDVSGWVENMRLEDGRVVADVEVIDLEFTLAGPIRGRDLAGWITKMDVDQIGLLPRPRDQGRPPTSQGG